MSRTIQREITSIESGLIDFLRGEGERIAYGTLKIEITYRSTNMAHVKSTEVQKTLNLGEAGKGKNMHKSD